MGALSSFGIKPVAEASMLALLAALRDHNDNGSRTPCEVDPDPFTSDNKADRAEAAEACQWCPIRIRCLRMAVVNGERHGIWAGHDMNTKTGREAAQLQMENQQ